MASETGEKGTKQSTNPWGDVDHLLDGYNEERKATIQKERSRRIAEQNKMFARKLCLVLDLDHTLLNSAKFVEVDPVHKDILRRTEEQDEWVPKSKDLDGVLDMKSAMVIIDDSVRVWSYNKLNLIVVERYSIFIEERLEWLTKGSEMLNLLSTEETSEDERVLDITYNSTEEEYTAEEGVKQTRDFDSMPEATSMEVCKTSEEEYGAVGRRFSVSYQNLFLLQFYV